MVHLVTLHYEREKRAIKSFVTGERERERVLNCLKRKSDWQGREIKVEYEKINIFIYYG